MPSYTRALVREVRQVGQAAPSNIGPVHTIFFGGGTPSLLPLDCYGNIFAALREAFALTPDCEITLEANPGTVDQAYLAGLRALGVNRLSFGVQSSHAWELKLLDRLHTFDDVVAAVRMARGAGFDAHSLGLNLDLIFALPYQSLTRWQATVQRALALEPDHLSLYALSLEQGTPLRSWVYRGLLPMPDSDLAADMYLWAADTLAAHGYEQYEISNWAKSKDEGRRTHAPESLPGVKDGKRPDASFILHPSSFIPDFACRHNLQYWRNLPYLGFGAGAHGSAAGWRYSAVRSPAAYIERLAAPKALASRPDFPFSSATVEKTAVTPESAMDETMMLGMRLVREGVRAADFQARFGCDLSDRYARQLRRLKTLGLIEWDLEGTRLTPGGRLLGNRVFREFV